MQLITQEHYDLMDQFEKTYKHLPMTREAKEFWPKGHVYTNGQTNDAFIAYRHGYAFARALRQA